MIPFYWIDGFQEYDRSVTRQGRERLAGIASIAREYGLDFQLLEVSDLVFGYDELPYVIHNGTNILAAEACARLPYANVNPQTERLLQSLARLAVSAGTWRLVNRPLFVDRDKERAYHFASLVGARPIPTCFAPDRLSNRLHLEVLERRLGPYPYIVKPAAMFAGIGIVKVDSRTALGAVLDLCAQSGQAYLVQPFLQDAVDCRVFLENHEVVACQKRIPAGSGYIGNPAQGGVAEAATPDGELARLSQELSKHITSGYLCVDWLITSSARFLSEIELCGAFFNLPEPERTNVARALFRSALKAPRSVERFWEG